MQGLYQWLLAGSEPHDIARQLAYLEGYARGDQSMLDRLWTGTIEKRAELDALLAHYIDRAPEALSPIEHAILLIGAFELQNMPETPYRVVINEAVELAKVYGGIDGHKYVNGVLDKLATRLRGPEIEAGRRQAASE